MAGEMSSPLGGEMCECVAYCNFRNISDMCIAIGLQ